MCDGDSVMNKDNLAVIKPAVQLKDDSLELPVAKGIAPEIRANQLFDQVSGMTVEQKLVRSMLGMRNIRTFYYAMYITLKRVEDTSIDTAGVTIDTMHYNPKYITRLSQPELMFLNFHLISHIAMQHNIRKGNRIQYLWNMACDLFINKLLSEEFGIKPGSGVNIVSEDTMGIGIQFPKGSLYEERIDIKTDTPESIYEVLLGSYIEKKQNETLVDVEGNKDSDGNKAGDGNEESKEAGKEGTESGSEKNKSDAEYKDVEYKGKKVGTLTIIDIVTNEEDKTLSDSQKQFKSKEILERASMMNKQISKDAGGYLERIVAEALAPKINWRSLLKNKLTEATQKINTYSKPDKRFLSRGQILPGPKQLDLDKLKGVKVCVDASGSVLDEDLGVALAQMKHLLKIYKADAELIYWDTQVRAKKEFKDVKEMLSIKPAGGGGTDVQCIFEYFDSKECKIKPTIIIIFTDGCFTMPPSKYKTKYRDTIWVVTYNRREFKPPFGLIADF